MTILYKYIYLFIYIIIAGSSLCNELITRLEEFYIVNVSCACVRVCLCLIACHLETWTVRWSRSDPGSGAKKKMYILHICKD